MKRVLSLLLVLCLVLSLSLPVSAVSSTSTTGYTKAEDVKYVYNTSQKYISNWGARDEDCVFLSPNALDFYTGKNTYETFAAMDGGTGTSSAPSSALYSSLKSFMSSKQTYQTSYNATRDLYKYTDCTLGDSSSISSFYSGVAIGPDWDGGATWNREHTWPNSKGDASGNGENDIMMLRPASVSENSSRGNKAYGESSGYYNPNSESGGKHDLRGDVSRIMLYVYVRWENTGSMWGSSGVIQSLDVLLKWMEEDPVDTWEMGRNDSVESITGTRNVFVDYPELAWLLFGEEIPSDMTTPSGMAKNGSGSTPAVCTHTNTELRNQKDSTCTSAGYSGDTYCLDCGVETATGTEIPMRPHTNNNNDDKCDDCGAAVTCTHTYAPDPDTAKPATCTTAGREASTCCIYCGALWSLGKTIPPLGHLNENGDNLCDREGCGALLNECKHGEGKLDPSTRLEPTCTQEGYSGDYVCIYCNSYVTQSGTVLEKLPHKNDNKDNKCDDCGATVDCLHGRTYEKGAKPATCTASGQEDDTYCFYCDELLENGGVIDPLGHKWVDADCDTPKTCSVCLKTEGNPNGHKLTSTSAKDATCKEAGNKTYYTCAVCQNVYEDRYGVNETTVADMTIPATGHTDANKDLRCDVCSSSICKIHTWADATCEKAKTCIHCGETEGRPLGHSWVDADCEHARTCSVCRSTTGKALGHEWVAADCDNPKTCATCHKTEGKALGHSFGPWENGKRSCATCGYEETEEQTADCPHAETVLRDNWEATCGADGYTGDLYCADCGAPISAGSVIPATGEHSFGEWVSNEDLNSRTCLDCGFVETEYNTPAETDPTETEPAPTDPSETAPAPTDPSGTEPAPTDPTPTEPSASDPTTPPAATDPTEPSPAPGFPVVPVVIVILVLVIGAAVILILKKKKAE